VPWWGWVVVTLAVLGVLTFALRRPLRFAIRVAKALATDERLPKPLRWAVRVSVAIKAVPGPDLGIDEILLAIVAIFLLTVYRPVFRQILAEAAAPRP
jgi:hypothetical protein